MAKLLNETVEFVGANSMPPANHQPSDSAMKLKQHFSQHNEQREYIVIGVCKRQDGKCIAKRLKNELSFQWRDGQDVQVATLKNDEGGMQAYELVSNINAILQHEFTPAHGCGDTPEQQLESFKSRFKLSLDLGNNLTSDEVVALVSRPMKTVLVVQSDQANRIFEFIQYVETFMSNVSQTGSPNMTPEFFSHYIESIARNDHSLYNDVARFAEHGPLRDPTHHLFQTQWDAISFAIQMLPSDSRSTLTRALRGAGFTVFDTNGSMFVVGLQAGNGQQAQQQQAQQPQQAAQPDGQAQQDDPGAWVNTLAITRKDQYGSTAGWYGLEPVYIIGRLTYDEFISWWTSQRIELKRAVLGDLQSNVYPGQSVRYTQFKGQLDDSDSTVRSTMLVSYCRRQGHLKVFAKMTLPRRRNPTYNVVYSMHTDSIKSFIPFATKENGAWHGHLYSLRNKFIDNKPTGLIVVYDPDGYLNALYAARPQGLSLHGDGPGVPQTIGNNVTRDMTQGIPRTSLQPLTAEQQAAIDAAVQRIDDARRAQEERERQVKEQTDRRSSDLQSQVPDAFKRPELAKLVQYWPGTQVQGFKKPFRLINADESREYVIIRFPGQSMLHELVGRNEVLMGARDLGIEEHIAPILDLIAQQLPNATPLMRFDGKLS